MLNKTLEALAKRAGIDVNDESFKSIIEKVKEVEISDEIATKLESNLFDIESAKQNYNLKTHFTALALNGIDGQVSSIFDELFPEHDDVKQEILGIKGTPKRVEALSKKIKELTEKKASAEGKGDDGKAKKAQEEIDRLINEFKVKEQNYQTQLQSEKTQNLKKLEELQNKFFLQGLEYDKSKTLEENLLLAEYHINNELSQKGAKRIYNEQTGKFELKRVDDESLDWLDERNSKPSYEEFSKGVLTQKKLLAVAGTGNDKPQPQPQPTPTGGSGLIDTSEFNKAIDEAISYQN